MVDCSSAIGIVEEGRQTVAGCFTELDVALDDGLEDQAFEVGFDLFVDLVIESCTAIVHRHEEALYVELCIESLAHNTDGIEELRDPLEGKVLALYGYEYGVGSHEGVDGDQPEGRRAIDEDVVVAIN